MGKLQKWFQESAYLKSAYLPHDLPLSKENEVAFWGRSNVGKSSLINALVNQKGLAKTSSKPGKTQTINFFTLGHGENKGMLVDLPGYGYAQVDKKKSAHWDEFIHYYLSERSQLKQLFLLIDSRRGIMKNDTEKLDFLSSYGIPTQIILTKSDLMKKKDAEKLSQTIEKLVKTNGNLIENILFTSSSKNLSIYDLQKEIWRLFSL